MNQTYFVTGINTDIGKTYATGLLAKALLAQGKTVITQKLIQTGVTGAIADDIYTHRQLMEVDILAVDKAGITCPHLFAKPASPHLAARLEGASIDLTKITRCTHALEADYQVVLLEGAGGILVPICENMLTIDYIYQEQYPIILVTSAILGSINHTLLTLEAIQQRNLTLHSVVFNHYFDDDADISADTEQYLRCYLAKHFPKTLFLNLYQNVIDGVDGWTSYF